MENEDIRNIIASNIVKYRKMCGMTQVELANHLNYSDKMISKWERAESLPDIIILKEMSKLFGVSVDALTSITQEKPTKRLRAFWRRIYSDKFLISAVGTIIVWLVATIMFVTFSLIFPNAHKFWLAFIFAIPVNLIVLLCLQKIWKSAWFNFICVSLLAISVALSVHLAFGYNKLWLLFMICIPIIALSFILFVMRGKIFKHEKK